MTGSAQFRGARDVIPSRLQVFQTHALACRPSVGAATALFAKDVREPREDFPRSPESALYV
jgi:hypothetical protein